MRVVGYLRVSTDEQARTGYGLDDQRRVIAAEADRHGWSVMWIEDKGASAKDMRRPGLDRAFEALGRSASGLVVAKLDRLSRSVVDFAQIVERAHREGWQLVIVDLGVDTTTPAGKLVANMFAALAAWEREIIGERTKAALAAAKARGVKVGRPSGVSPETVAMVRALRDGGMTLRQIAAELTKRKVPTPQGGKRWWPSTIRVLLG